MRRFIVILLAMLMVVPALAQADDTIVDIASASDDFTTLVAAVVEADLAETLSGGEFTVFAPTNGAFETLLATLDVTAEELLAREDLSAILTYHVVPGTVNAETLTGMMTDADGPLEVETVNGAVLTFALNEDGVIEINNGAASISQADIIASNGVIHVIDNVLLPPMGMDDEDMDMTEEMGDTIVDIASASDDFTTLVAAVVEADLAETLSGGEFTVFAPTNGAFETLLGELDATAEELLAREDLADILTYHVVEGTVDAETLTGMMTDADGPLEVETVNGAVLTFALNDDGDIIINGGEASISQTDIIASNGVIHVIDNVLLPPMDMDDEDMDMTEEMGDTIVDIATNSDVFTTLVAAVVEADLAETLSGGDFTVFAPTDGAFETLLGELDATAEELLAREDLADILTYHVVEGTVDAASLTEMIELSEEPLEVETVNGAVLTFALNDDGDIIINGGEASISQTDIIASNGVIHVIDNVLLPPAEMDMDDEDMDDTAADETVVDIAVGNGDFSTLVAAVVEADLAETLATGEFTVFAPTNGAFETLLTTLDVTAEELLAREDLRNILTYHVVPGTVNGETLTGMMADADGPLEVETVNGAILTFALNDDGVIIINGGVASISQTDITASNGVIHVIDNVLLPPMDME